MSWDVWGGGNGDWSNPNKWSSGIVPKPGDDIYATYGAISVGSGVDTANDYIWMNATASGSLSLVLNQASLGQNSTVVMQGNGASLELANFSTLLGTIISDYGNSAITVDAGGYGQNNGTVEASSWQPMTMQIVANGIFSNVGQISSGSNATLLTDFRGPEMYNSGLMQAVSGGNLTLTSLQPSVTSYGKLYNYGTIMANGGSVNIFTDLTQIGRGSVDIYNNGSVTVNGIVDGGTIQIQSGMLNFADPQFVSPIPFASSTCSATLALVGPSAELVFQGVTNDQIAMEFRPAMNDLLVTETLRGSQAQVADLHLTGASFTAANFTTHGNEILYNAHPTA